MFENLRAWLVAPVITEIREGLILVATREETAYANLSANIAAVRDGWASLKSENERLTAERDQYRVALEAADANQAQAVADALAADSDHDAAAIEAADASLAELVAQPEPTPEPAPEGDTPVNEQPAGDQPA